MPEADLPIRKPASKHLARIDAHVGAQIRQLRLAQGMAQAELGRRIGVSFMQVQKYEGGTDRVSASRLFEIAQVFGVAIGSFFDGL